MTANPQPYAARYACLDLLAAIDHAALGDLPPSSARAASRPCAGWWRRWRPSSRTTRPTASAVCATLADEVEHLLPTPQAHDAVGGKTPEQVQAMRERTGAGVRNLNEEVCLLPTPAVNDMGAGKTPEDWDRWTDDMKARHGNGNGHGKSLAIEAMRLGGDQ